ncbi:endonuclease [Streptomyces violascens]|uniref:Endonuclease n=1 Tax=Streptomyces violascens TaxID=67381 RepID=A0ABQ3QTN2_9ACTN|nr:endonuclease [Streptomyces violascens]GHI40631.1 endonuclease [Streptomyces violascens]
MDSKQMARQVLHSYGETYAGEAGIRLRDTPAPLYQLLVLCVLFAVPIRAQTALAAARELFAAGFRTPRAMADSSWQDRVDALGRAHYRRYDESTATALGDGAELVLERWHGDLRALRKQADGDLGRMRELLQEVPRIGPTGADIFCREAQAVWPEVRPFFDARARKTAAGLGLPRTPKALADLVQPRELVRLADGLVRVGLTPDATEKLRHA